MRSKFIIPCLFLLLIFSVTIVYAASFNCVNARTVLEKTICNNKELSDLDGELGKLYFSLKSKLSKEEFKAFKDDHMKWLALRVNSCEANDSKCLSALYRERNEKLTKLLNGDDVFKKEVIFTSEVKGEELFQVRVYNKSDNPVYIFMGAIKPENKDDSGLVNIYEFSFPDKIHIIDTFPLSAFHSKGVHSDSGVYFEQWYTRNYDNLIFVDGNLLYYIEKGGPENKSYFSYRIGSKGKPAKTDEKAFLSANYTKSNGAFSSIALSPDGKILATNSTYNIIFSNISNIAPEDLMKMSSEERYRIGEGSAGKFNLLMYFPGNKTFCNKEALFAGMRWNPSGDILFFDNSGKCYACIWMINVKTKVVKKLVGEHEAIHPWFFVSNGKEYLAYVQKNQIRRIEIDTAKLSGSVKPEKESYFSKGFMFLKGAENFEGITNSIGQSFEYIKPGKFIMGSDFTGNSDEQPSHSVTLTKGFYMQTTEVTQGQWFELMGTKPWEGKKFVKEGSDYPASYISWNDAVAFIDKLNRTEGTTKYRLPTEAEWEYACRAGYSYNYGFDINKFSLVDYAWFDKNTYLKGEKYAHPVGVKKPNRWGLYDMHGNLAEWCSDYYGRYTSKPEVNPVGKTDAKNRRLRGGFWECFDDVVTSSFRDERWVGEKEYYTGFRIVKDN